MIKANAYGHGAVWAARTLQNEPGIYGLGVATLEEGQEVRSALPSHSTLPVIVFSGAMPWSEEAGTFCEKHRLRPVIADYQDLCTFLSQGWSRKIPYDLKFNTGMNRLGMDSDCWSEISSLYRNHDHPPPFSVMTHLAIAESPEHKKSREQKKKLETLFDVSRTVFPKSLFHVANSACIWNAKKWGKKAAGDLSRPGLSLYGIPPWSGAAAKGLRPVMTIRGRILQTRELPAGVTIGYGAHYRTKKRERIGILGAGYADGLHRMLSNRGSVREGNSLRPVLGTISMDLSAVRLSKKSRAGDWVTLLGKGMDPWKQAEAAGTIPYEILTSVSNRVERKYV